MGESFLVCHDPPPIPQGNMLLSCGLALVSTSMMIRMEFIRPSFAHYVGVCYHVAGRRLLLVAHFLSEEEGVALLKFGLRTPARIASAAQGSLLLEEGQKREEGF